MFGDTQATSFRAANAASADSQIIAVVPASSLTGTVDITVLNGSVSSAITPSDRYTFTGTGPAVTSVTPSTGSNMGTTPVTITGANFNTGATASLTRTGYSSFPLSIVVVPTSTSISATVPSGLVVGTWNIVVTNPDGQSGIGSNLFTVTAPVPTVTAISPATGINTMDTPVTITGTNFKSNGTISLTRAGFNDVPLPDVGGSSATSLSSIIPAGVTAGTWNVKVTNYDGQSGTGSNLFTVTAPPTVTGIQPNYGVNTKTTAVTITGTGFVTGAAASLTRSGYTDVALTNVAVPTAASITASVPAGITAGTWNVKVTNPDGRSATGNSLFTVTSPAQVPTVTGVSPNTSANTKATAVTISGTNFVAGATVTFTRPGPPVCRLRA